MSLLPQIGESVVFEKTVAESDVYLFAGITGDFSGNHVNAEFMRTSAFGQRIAHGALLVGFMSTASTQMINLLLARGCTGTPVALGYDGVRFVAPVFFGDTVKVTYTIATLDEQRQRSVADMQVLNQHNEIVAVGKHLIKWLPRRPKD